MSKLNPNQLEAVNFEYGSLLVVAGAGTGKTSLITERIAHLINEKEDDIELIETSLGLSEFNENTINLYPNPSNSSFRFTITEFPILEEKVDVSILNSMGQIIEKTSFKSIEELENYSFGENFVQGIYMVNLKNGTNQLQKRIVKLK